MRLPTTKSASPCRGFGQKGGDVIGGMLAVAIHRQRPRETALDGATQAGTERSALAVAVSRDE